jgi:cell pole-organizing protein PopZ
MAAQQTNMEEILTSIRTTLAEETAKAGTPAAPAELVEVSDEEVLALSEADVAPSGEVEAPAEEIVDLTAFGQGEMKMQSAADMPAPTDVLGQGEPEQPAAAPVVAPVPAAVAPVTEPAVPAPAPTPASAVTDDHLDKLISEISATPAPVLASPAAAPTAPVAAPASSSAAPEMMPLGLVNDVADLQVALPAEVLAAALRPLVQTWLEQNLAGVVERLVQAEISKLANDE